MKKLFNTKSKIKRGPIGNIRVTHGTCETSGHFWGRLDKVTDKLLVKKIIKMMDNYKIELNMSDEDYNFQLMRNIRDNDVDKYYNSMQLKKIRKNKLNKIKI